jgi:site-specific DNA-methyltransferase (adenine-specific)
MTQNWQILIHSDNAQFVGKFKSMFILTDPPYGTTQNKWDTPADTLITDWLPNNLGLVTTADIKYAVKIIDSNFSHDLIWQKTIGSGQLNINHRPLKTHELVLIFKGTRYVYNRLKTIGTPYKLTRNIETQDCYGDQVSHVVENTGERDQTTILRVSNPRKKAGHPTQKPIELFQKLVDMYSDKDDVILDPFAGSGTILDVNRNVVAIEKGQ